MLARFLPWRLLTALLLTGVGAVAISISILYNTTVTTEISKLQALAQSHGKLINSVAQYDAQFNKAFPNGNSRGATLYQVTNAHFENIEFGSTGEIVIGEIRNGKIYFLIPSRVLGAEIPPVDQNAKTAEPMRRALLGRSGSMLAPDYRGRQVLAWYEPIPDLDAGIVAKINISEIRKPFDGAAEFGKASVGRGVERTRPGSGPDGFAGQKDGERKNRVLPSVAVESPGNTRWRAVSRKPANEPRRYRGLSGLDHGNGQPNFNAVEDGRRHHRHNRSPDLGGRRLCPSGHRGRILILLP